MAVNSLSQNINQAISDLNGVKQAIIDKGVEIPSGTKTSEYGAKISEIQTGEGTPEKGFLPTEWDADGYPTKGTLYGTTVVPNYYFYNTSSGGQYARLENINFKNAITSIGNNAFYYCKNLALTSLPEGVTSIGSFAFQSCSKLALTSFPEGLISIDRGAFNYCSGLTSINIGNATRTIGDFAFKSCSGLTSVSIGSAIKSISSDAFGNCPKLTSITINRAEGTVANAPWGATNAQINWVGDN